ncbi:MAG: Type I transmembrane sorting receptor [Alyxoria varia]|nr:MAG: Type I transmembrane sorting receptor [Alyxoria varia]
MHSKDFLAALAAITDLALASPFSLPSHPHPKPVDLTARQSRFTVHQVPNRNSPVRTGASAYRKALAKYGVKVPTTVQRAAAQSTGSVPANPGENDIEYTSPVTLGSNTLQLDFDTGSADLWAFSTETPNGQSAGHKLYDPKNATKLPDTWRIRYGDGSGASGTVYADKVVVGGVTATKQAVEAATSVSGVSFEGSDGLLGLAASKINTVTPNGQSTFFDTVKEQLDKPLFTCTLKKGAPGTYDFGYVDESKADGEITYFPVDFSQGFWQFDSSIGSAIADTGTTLLLTTPQEVEKYYGQVDSARNDQQAGGYTIDCDAELPDYEFTIGEYAVTVPGPLVNYAPAGDGTCFGGIQENQGLPFSILGDVFLKSQFVVFDGGEDRIGFAPQAKA